MREEMLFADWVNEIEERLSGILKVYSSNEGRWNKTRSYIIDGTELGFFFSENKIYWVTIDSEGNIWSHEPEDALDLFHKHLSGDQLNTILFNLDIFQ